MKKILILSTSLRKGSNSDILAKEFERGAREAGMETEFLSLTGKQIGYCKGCLSCQRTHQCVIRDDAAEMAAKAKDADVLAFATPVYYYSMSGQMKTLLDRMNPLFSSDYRFRQVFLIATAADDEKNAVDGTITGLQGWIRCFPKAALAGVVYGVGMTDAQEAKEHPDVLQEAYRLGQSADQ